MYHEDQDDAVEEEDKRLPVLEAGDTVKIEKLYGEQHFTQPPPRYSEASLVKALEQYGIGRPSTYASIISTLVNREYVTLDKKRFMPTDVGRIVNKFLTEHFAHWVDYEFTAKLEDELDDISNGKDEWIPVLERFWKDFSAQIEEKESVSRKDVTQEQMDEMCPKCGKHHLTIRLGRRGRFIGCTGYPGLRLHAQPRRRGRHGAGQARAGRRSEDAQDHLAMQGPYGPYVQLGEQEGDTKPKRVSVPKNIAPDTVTARNALKLLALPRDLGNHPETGKKVVAAIGRFGPYVSHDGRSSRSRRTRVSSTSRSIAPSRCSRNRSSSAPAGRSKVLGKHPQRRAAGRALLRPLRPVREARQGERHASRTRR